MQLFGKDTEGIVRGDEVYFRDAGVGCEGAKHLNSIDRTAGSGYGEGDVVGVAHRNDYR